MNLIEELRQLVNSYERSIRSATGQLPHNESIIKGPAGSSDAMFSAPDGH